MIALWRRGCAIYGERDSDEFREIDKQLTWRLVGPWSCSLCSANLDGPPDDWCSPEYAMYIDWPIAQAWRRALIDATGLRPPEGDAVSTVD
jgi:hypothetical protein